MAKSDAPLIVIVGPTASGKTSLAIDLAVRFDGEIICADSRTIYKGMDIGTAKPTQDEQARVPHWGLDLVQPGERFTAFDFKRYATEKICEIRTRGKVPILVGGTGLYVDSVVFNYQFDTENDENSSEKDNERLMLRKKLESFTTDELKLECYKKNIVLPENSNNKRHLISAIMRAGRQSKREVAPINNTTIVGVTTDRQILRKRIEKRVQTMFDEGIVEETTNLASKYGWDSEAMTANIYQIVRKLVNKEITLEQALELSSRADRKLAKRQVTWLKRNKFIKWYSLDDANHYLTQLLDTSLEA